MFEKLNVNDLKLIHSSPWSLLMYEPETQRIQGSASGSSASFYSPASQLCVPTDAGLPQSHLCHGGLGSSSLRGSSEQWGKQVEGAVGLRLVMLGEAGRVC